MQALTTKKEFQEVFKSAAIDEVDAIPLGDMALISSLLTSERMAVNIRYLKKMSF